MQEMRRWQSGGGTSAHAYARADRGSTGGHDKTSPLSMPAARAAQEEAVPAGDDKEGARESGGRYRLGTGARPLPGAVHEGTTAWQQCIVPLAGASGRGHGQWDFLQRRIPTRWAVEAARKMRVGLRGTRQQWICGGSSVWDHATLDHVHPRGGVVGGTSSRQGCTARVHISH